MDWQNRFRFSGTKEHGYSVCWNSIGSFGKVYRVPGGWGINITTPPPKEWQWDPKERYFFKSCACGEEIVSGGPFKTRLEAAQTGRKRYKELNEGG